MSTAELPEAVPLVETPKPTEGRPVSLRRAEVDRRHAMVSRWLAQVGFHGVLLTDPASMSWFTAGGELVVGQQADSVSVSLFITPQLRCVVAGQHEAPRLFSEELDGLGFQCKEYHWTRSARDLLCELCTGRQLATDQPFPGTAYRGTEISNFRRNLTAYDHIRLRRLASTVSHATEATARNIEQGATEWEIHGQLAHRLIHRGVEPVDIRIYADHHLDRHPRPKTQDRPVNKICTLLVTGKSRGLCTTTSRTVSFGDPGLLVRERFRLSAMASGSLLRFSIPGQTSNMMMQRAIRLYQKHDYEFNWRDAPLGGFAGYVSYSKPFLPNSPELIPGGSALAWTPQVEGLVSADTVVAQPSGPVVLHASSDWPLMGITLSDVTIDRPDILVR